MILMMNYSRMVSCHLADSVKNDGWTIDSSASDHMTGVFDMLTYYGLCEKESLINLPTGETSKVHT